MSAKLKEARAENRDPINFTCGGCKQVHPYSKTHGLECPSCSYGKDPVKEK